MPGFNFNKPPKLKTPEQEGSDKKQRLSGIGAVGALAALGAIAAHGVESPKIPHSNHDSKAAHIAEGPNPNTGGVRIERGNKDQHPVIHIPTPEKSSGKTIGGIEGANTERIPVSLNEHRISVDEIEH